MASCLFFVVVLCLPFIVKAQERSPHGLAFESPIAVSPEAYSFFHPETQKKNTTTSESLCNDNNNTSGCSRFPTASSVQSNLAHESLPPTDEGGDKRMGAGGMVGIALGFGFAIVLALGVYYVAIARNAMRTKVLLSSSSMSDSSKMLLHHVGPTQNALILENPACTYQHFRRIRAT